MHWLVVLSRANSSLLADKMFIGKNIFSIKIEKVSVSIFKSLMLKGNCTRTSILVTTWYTSTFKTKASKHTCSFSLRQIRASTTLTDIQTPVTTPDTNNLKAVFRRCSGSTKITGRPCSRLISADPLLPLDHKVYCFQHKLVSQPTVIFRKTGSSKMVNIGDNIKDALGMKGSKKQNNLAELNDCWDCTVCATFNTQKGRRVF